MESKKILFISTFAILITVLFAIYYTPTIQVFGDSNPYWNGLSILKSRLNATSLNSYSSLPFIGQGFVLIIIGPQKPFYAQEIASIEQFLNTGGTLIIADNFGTGNQLISSLGLDSRFGNQTVYDPVFSLGNPSIIYAFSSIKSIKNITLYYSTYLILGSNYKVIANSSIFSYININNTSVKYGPFPIIAYTNYGKGKVVLIATPYIWVNFFINGGNLELLDYIIQNETAILDVSHWYVDTLTIFKEYEFLAYSILSTPFIKYSILIGSVAFIFLYKFEKSIMSKSDEIEKIIKENPDWDAELIRRIKEERENYGSK